VYGEQTLSEAVPLSGTCHLGTSLLDAQHVV
jgi:hypothetical protein